MGCLTMIFMRSVGTLQHTRPLGRVGSKFNWQSDSVKESIQMGFSFYPICTKQIEPFNRLKTTSKFRDLSSTIAMNAYCFGAIAPVCAISHYVIGKIGGYVHEFHRSKYDIPHTLKPYNSRASVG